MHHDFTHVEGRGAQKGSVSGQLRCVQKSSFWNAHQGPLGENIILSQDILASGKWKGTKEK